MPTIEERLARAEAMLCALVNHAVNGTHEGPAMQDYLKHKVVEIHKERGLSTVQATFSSAAIRGNI